jgi:CheY-like chemotaxis protein
VEVYSDPFEGLRVACATPPAAIVLDLLMPGLNGFDFLERLRQAPAARTTPVIVWTGKDLQPDEAVSLAQYARSVVQKGKEGPDALLRELRAVLPNQGRRTT